MNDPEQISCIAYTPLFRVFDYTDLLACKTVEMNIIGPKLYFINELGPIPKPFLSFSELT